MEVNFFKLLFENPLLGTTILFAVIIILLAFYTFNKLQTISILKKNITALTRNIKDLEHQAKLIIKSDMELKLYQEEVEDKLHKLTFLKNIILSLLNVLDKNELFSQISEKTINDLGFNRGLLLNFGDLEVKLNFGFETYEINEIKRFLTGKKNLLNTHPLIASDTETGKEIAPSLPINDFLIAPIKTREQISTIFIVSGLAASREIKRAEKEIFSIVCMYLGQCLDNIQLFEKIYHAKDELESKVKERTHELVKSLREIETISKLKSDFISSVSHELRTPLTSVKGFSSLLVEEKFGKLPPEAKSRLEKIDANVNKLVDMVNTLLDIARIESGRMVVKIAPSNIVKLIKDTIDFLSPQAQSKEITLKSEAPSALTVLMDKDLIERVLINLINNAIKFTPAKGTITVECQKGQNSAAISVKDTGCGMKKEDAEKIFQEFFRVDNAMNREVKGSGLGLSLVKRIIDTHKEKIWVNSEAGKGTCFCFTLKLAEDVKTKNFSG